MNDSFVDVAEQRLRHDIVNSVFQAGAKLRVEELSRRYTVGATPVREALSRLKTEGLVELFNNRGFRVPELTLEDLTELAISRGIIESEVAKDAMLHKNEEWELNLMSAMERLRRRAAADLAIPENHAAFFDAHHQFHAAMVAGSQLKRLLVVQTWLEQQQSRYFRRLPATAPGWSAQFVQSHEDLLALALGDSADLFSTALREHPLLSTTTIGSAGVFGAPHK
ncbi:GntR family transcriptional regulator [Variovorax paradoxus]|uniref:GntR family transcriptional regulator n=1 Tax=Variovorax paradoxus TaxID=34073 RepID=UPI003D658FA0